jgi:hypothetical protein
MERKTHVRARGRKGRFEVCEGEEGGAGLRVQNVKVGIWRREIWERKRVRQGAVGEWEEGGIAILIDARSFVNSEEKFGDAEETPKREARALLAYKFSTCNSRAWARSQAQFNAHFGLHCMLE